MKSFTDQKPQVATEEHLILNWSGAAPGERFRCYLCGHRFAVGDIWRFVFDMQVDGAGNMLVCKACDGPDVIKRWRAHVADAKKRFWWLYR